MTAYKRSLRNNRVLLLRELPDAETLVSAERFKPSLTLYEKREILSFTVPSDRAAKLLDVVEGKNYETYERFLTVLRQLKPSLASTLEATEREIRDSSAASSPCSSGSSDPPLNSLPNGEHSRQPSADLRPNVAEEDAGVYGLKGSGPGPVHRLSRLSYAGRQFLAERLNGTPQDRNTFNNFCEALGVEQRLVQVSKRSGNPTGYLMQEYSERPEATFDRLERALSDIGQRDLFEQLQAVDSRLMNGEDDV